MTGGLEVRIARLEGEVAHIVKRLDSIDNWLRVIIGLQVTGLIATMATLAAIIQLLL